MLERDSLERKLISIGNKCKITRQKFYTDLTSLNHKTLIISVFHKNHAQMWSSIIRLNEIADL